MPCGLLSVYPGLHQELQHQDAMGCDIHLYIEYRQPDSTREQWNDFGSRFNPGRNYVVFGRLAGVRESQEPHIEPRGIPDDIAYHTQNDYWLIVGAHGTPSATAEGWVRSGSSTYKTHEPSGTLQWVSHPDAHTGSWLTPDEFEKALKQGCPPEYRAILAVLKAFDELGFMSRVVFWFDN